MSSSNTGPIQDGSNDPTRIDADHETREQLRTFANLHAFKRDILWTLFHEDGREAYGILITRLLEALYGDVVTHGGLYPNLDDLVEADLVAKSALDKRTNNYALTDEAEFDEFVEVGVQPAVVDLGVVVALELPFDGEAVAGLLCEDGQDVLLEGGEFSGDARTARDSLCL